MDAANATNKLFTRYGAIAGPQPDLVAIQRNMTEYAAALNFLIRGLAREAVSAKMFMADLAPVTGTHVGGPKGDSSKNPGRCPHRHQQKSN